MQYFPLFVDTQRLSALVVGAGDVAARKLELLCRTEAEITVIALSACDEVLGLASQNKIKLELREVNKSDIRDIHLLYMATSDPALNHKMAEVAHQKNILANVVDAPDECSFITPAIVDRGKLQIAISSSGAAPVFVSQLRARIETWLPSSVSGLMDFVAKKRSEVQSLFKSGQSKRQFWQRFFERNGVEYTEFTANAFIETKDDVLLEKESSAQSEIILLKQTANISNLPISIIPVLQQIELVLSEKKVPFELNELIRRDAIRAQFKCAESLSLDGIIGKVLIIADSDALSKVHTKFIESFYLDE
ncbi:bifunctional precorrin-2 dehydrogenase/sirohydrochlorin ferrochelatase [Parashewanella spongiae]|uniref:precorrin-2 dehydrogenase n=1 Tax=Parashewanella spongiae TaxID=342950 RepID=A0A3A6U4L4_9GAMM|nr:bifunctional precorrin-2 dehydrogenase/sirohydrochlorin ferrochelatase [Parashewanella spongiae]MCL1077003.1 bifunctional precorrin-2 dehydrogenase/sirohydrochlorin ferrochelatase [Parashewanella spongiae]RJY19108.1 bifunctional precorrin-2 dehydrogenase/sirohydrochlorin ferrochelatase [Parashewanella spongiae]